jgi:outer membrane protein assembly factor BamB
MSSDMRTLPCAEWVEKLAALHPDDLTSAERDELRIHLASCSGCAQVYQDYHHLASLVRDIATSKAPPDLLPGLPELPNEQEETKIRSTPFSQPGTTSSLPARIPGRRPRRAFRVAVAVIAAVLVAGVLVGSFAIRGQSTVSPGISQGRGPVYYITPQGGPPTSSTPQIGSNGPAMLSNPTPPFFVDGNVYRDSNVYRADTGAPVQQYLKDLGNVQIYQPRLVDGILYMAVRTAVSPGIGKFVKMVMYALRPSDGAVLWKWDNCGESVNMSAPTIINRVAYFVCEAAPTLYKLYALQARTGTLIWVDTLSDAAGFDPPGDQQAVYVVLHNQLLAESADTGKLLWKRSLGDSGDYINQATLDNGILYITKQKAFYALRASDGARLWEYQFVGDYSYLQTVVAQNVVYLIANGQSAATSIYTLDGTTGALRWQKQLSSTSYGFPVVDHGDLYLVEDVFATPQQRYAVPFKRTLLAIQGSNGRTLWQQDIPWNKGKLYYAMFEPPDVSAGGGRVYLVDWQQSADPQNLKATMGAFSKSNGALLWTRDITQIW